MIKSTCPLNRKIIRITHRVKPLLRRLVLVYWIGVEGKHMSWRIKYCGHERWPQLWASTLNRAALSDGLALRNPVFRPSADTCLELLMLWLSVLIDIFILSLNIVVSTRLLYYSFPSLYVTWKSVWILLFLQFLIISVETSESVLRKYWLTHNST